LILPELQTGGSRHRQRICRPAGPETQYQLASSDSTMTQQAAGQEEGNSLLSGEASEEIPKNA
jgi:hypothetical protein